MRWWPYTIVSTIVVLTYFSLSNVGRAHRQEDGGDRPQLFTTTPCCCNRVLRRKFSTAITAQDSGFGIRGSLVWGGSAIRGPIHVVSATLIGEICRLSAAVAQTTAMTAIATCLGAEEVCWTSHS